MSYINTNYKYSEETSRIIACAMEVYKLLGNGFQEVIYQRALSIEMQLQGIEHRPEKEISINIINLSPSFNYKNQSSYLFIVNQLIT